MRLFFENALFPWGGLPYPSEHARYGIELIEQGKNEEAYALAAFQQATLDHRQKPVYALFRQEKGIPFTEIEQLNRLFFHRLNIHPEEEYHFVDAQLGIVSYRTENQTVICLGSGCKSGMGSCLVGHEGVINFGPQLVPIGDCSGFGLAGRGQQIEANEQFLRYQCRLAAPHSRNTGIAWLQDSGYCSMWMQAECAFEENQLRVTCTFDGYRPLGDFLFTFFVKAEALLVARSHKLTPRSLDRYQGPPQPIQMGSVQLLPESGCCAMEIVPLAGDDSFWGADFMVSLSKFVSTDITFSLGPAHK